MPHDSADRGEFLDPVFRKQALLIELTMTKTGGPATPAAGSIGGGSPQLNNARKNERWPVSKAGGLP